MESKASANGIDIAYRVQGQGPPLLLVMGLTATMDWWDPAFVQSLARRHTVVSFDNRGAGRSVCERGEFSIEQFADDTCALMDALGIERASVLGYSMGGMIAQELALRHPGRLERLILLATYCGGPGNVLCSRETLARLVDRSGTVDELVDRFLSLMFARDWLRENGPFVAAFKQRYLLAPTCDHAAARQFMAVSRFDVSERLGSISASTLVACGAEDILVLPENSRFIAGRIPGAQLIEYPGAGHGFVWQYADRCLADLARFLG